MTLKEAREQIDMLAETFESCSIARRKLAGHALTVELFDEINGPERGLENLIGDSVYLPELTAEEVLKLKGRILDALTDSEIDIGKKMHAALECYCDPLITAMQTFDANYENNAKLKGDLVEKLKGLADDGVTTFFSNKCDFFVYQYTQAIEACNIIKKFGDFLDSKNCNLGRIAQLSTMQGGEMSDDDKQFLKEMREAFKAGEFYEIWKLSDDRLTGASLTDCGYDVDKLVELVETLFKVETTFFATVRKFKEALVKDTETSDKVCVKNCEFYNAIDSVLWFCDTVCTVRRQLWEQLSMIDKQFSVQAPAKKEEPAPEKKDDTQQQEPEKKEDTQNKETTEIPSEPNVNTPEE